jgi:hypothetical protein
MCVFANFASEPILINIRLIVSLRIGILSKSLPLSWEKMFAI